MREWQLVLARVRGSWCVNVPSDLVVQREVGRNVDVLVVPALVALDQTNENAALLVSTNENAPFHVRRAVPLKFPDQVKVGVEPNLRAVEHIERLIQLVSKVVEPVCVTDTLFSCAKPRFWEGLFHRIFHAHLPPKNRVGTFQRVSVREYL